MSDVKLSVIMPCYNSGRFLSDAITSILTQEYSAKPFELIVVNDQSSDENTVAVLDRWRSADERVSVLDNRSGHKGPAAARNLGIEAARGEWLAFLDADDLWLPGGLQARWEVAEANLGAEWICADCLLLHEDGSVDNVGYFEKGDVARRFLDRAFRTHTVQKLQTPVVEFLTSSLAWTGTVMVKKRLVSHLGGFHKTLRGPEDTHLWIRLARVTDLFFVPRRVALYRQHGASLMHQDGPPEAPIIAAFRLLLEDPEFRPYRHLIHRKLAVFHGQNAYYHRSRGESFLAVRSGLRAVMNDPLNMNGWKNLVAAATGRR